MNYWSSVSQTKGLISDTHVPASDVMGRGKDGFMGWGSNSENRGSEELGFHQTAKSSCFGNNPVQESSICGVPSERDSTPVTSTTNTFSNSVVESKTMGSSVAALNLSRFADRRDVDDLNASRAAPDLSSGEIWGPLRSFRGGVGSVPYCIVHGCMKDLSSSKVYHRRHKVCEIHSKTLNVLVNGIEQRFCQQCSRFHSVTEFDDGKHSCRLRLAGHNERRRKPQRVSHGNKSEKIPESYIGRRLHEVPDSQTTPFGCEDILANNLQHPHKSRTNDCNKQRKLDGGSICYPPLAMPAHCFEKSCPPLHANAVRLESGRESYKNSHRIPHDMEVPRSMSGAIRNDNVIFFDSASTVKGLSGMSTSFRARSLLSPQSHNSSSYSSGITTAPSLSLSENYFNHHAGQGSEKLLGPGRRQDSTSGLQHKFNSTGMNPTTKGRNSSPILIRDDADDVNSPNEIFQGSKHRKRNDQSSRDNGPTISIQALSSQLQRLEQRRRSVQVNQDKGGS